MGATRQLKPELRKVYVRKYLSTSTVGEQDAVQGRCIRRCFASALACGGPVLGKCGSGSGMPSLCKVVGAFFALSC